MTRDNNHTRRLYRIEEFGLRNSMSRSLIYTLIKEGKLRTVKVGRNRCIPADAEDEFLASLSAEAA